MAYVRVTENLVDGVQAKVDRMERTALAANETPPQDAVVDEMAELAVQNAYSEAPHLRGSIPESWLGELHWLHVLFLDDVTGAASGVSFAKDYNGAVKAPGLGRPYRYRIQVNLSDLPPQARDWHDRARAALEEEHNIKQRYRTVRDQLTAFLRAHTSLNTAIKEMPELEMYLPQEFMDRLNAPNPKKSKKTEDRPQVEVDRDTVASLGVAHRLTSSGG